MYISELGRLVREFGALEDRFLAGRRPTTERLEPGTSDSDVSLRCPAYRENLHANHTWNRLSHRTRSFLKALKDLPVGSIRIARSTLRLAQAT
jgi:hypothetical protein